jgi:hypothetical protein
MKRSKHASEPWIAQCIICARGIEGSEEAIRVIAADKHLPSHGACYAHVACLVEVVHPDHRESVENC